MVACFIWPSLFYAAADANNSKSKTVKAFFLACMFMFVVCTFDVFQQYQPTKQELDVSETTTLGSRVIELKLNRTRELFLTPQLYLLKKEQANDESLDVTRVEPANPDEAESIRAGQEALKSGNERSKNGSKLFRSSKQRTLSRVKRDVTSRFKLSLTTRDYKPANITSLPP